jgi:nucleotide-binding universal stress UspA family protein
MYKNILVMLDNSSYSLWGLDMAMDIARSFNSVLTGNHVYAARLHEKRFVQMEPGLPAKYQQPEELQKQRDIHADLIEKGLKIISDSYLDVFQDRCEKGGVPYIRKAMEGKNYSEIVRDIKETPYDLVAMGARGLGEVPTTQLGSVCERVARRITVDTLVMKNGTPLRGGHVVVGIDGSEQSYAAMTAAIALHKKLGCQITALAVFDPDFHYKAFDSIAKVLSEEAGQIFRFKDQEKLHEEIIDSGLEKIYQDNLDLAKKIAEREGVTISTQILAGKPYDEIIKWLDGKNTALMILGKIGVHSDEGLDIGSNSETLLRQAPCNVMLVSRKVKPDPDAENQKEMEWDADALELLNRVPGFVRNMVRGHMEANARKHGAERVTAKMMKDARSKMGF